MSLIRGGLFRPDEHRSENAGFGAREIQDVWPDLDFCGHGHSFSTLILSRSAEIAQWPAIGGDPVGQAILGQHRQVRESTRQAEPNDPDHQRPLMVVGHRGLFDGLCCGAAIQRDMSHTLSNSGRGSSGQSAKFFTRWGRG